MCQDGSGRTGNNDTAESLKWGYSAFVTIIFGEQQFSLEYFKYAQKDYLKDDIIF